MPSGLRRGAWTAWTAWTALATGGALVAAMMAESKIAAQVVALEAVTAPPRRTETSS